MTKQDLISFADFQDRDRVWITIQRVVNGKMMIIRRNHGLHPLELLGLAALASMDIHKQMIGEVLPDLIKREVLLGDEEPEQAASEDDLLFGETQ